MKKIAILGAGFIGGNLLASYAGSGCEVDVLDKKEYEGKAPEGMRLIWRQGLLQDMQLVRDTVAGADVVYHMISGTVPGDRTDPVEELMTDVAGTVRLLEECVRSGVGRLIFISSSSVYGRQEKMPVREDAATDPISSHGIQKLVLEKYLQLYRYEHGLDVRILRLSNPYGPGQDIYGRQGFIAIALGAVASGKPLTIRGDGETVRDYLYIDDVVRACRMAEAAAAGSLIFNIGSGRGWSLREIVGVLDGILGKNIPVQYAENRKADIPVSILDIGRAEQELGYQPSVDLTEGLRRTLAFHGIEGGAQ